MIVNNVKNMNLANNLVPGKLEILLYGIVASVVVVIGNLSFFTDQLLKETGATSDTLFGLVKAYIGNIFGYVDNFSISATGAVFLFWSLAGVIVFSILQSVLNVSAEIKNDVDVSTHFLHPRNYTNRNFWFDVLSQFAVHVLLYLVSLAWIMFVALAVVPYSVNTSRYFFADKSMLNSIMFACAFILLYICVIVFAIFIKLLFRRKQIDI